MEPEQTSIKLDIAQWGIRIDERSRGRMKLNIKLSKDEATAFKNFADVVKPEETTYDEFLKFVFLTGAEALNRELSEHVKKYASENREELATSGITVIDGEDGEVTLADTSVLNAEVSGAPSIQDNVLPDDEIRKHVK